MAIGTNNFELFGKLALHDKNSWRIMPNESYEEFDEFGDNALGVNKFIQIAANVTCYCGRDIEWRARLHMHPGLRSGLDYMLRGSGPMREIKRIAREGVWQFRPREELIAIAMGGDANPEIIEFLKRGEFKVL